MVLFCCRCWALVADGQGALSYKEQTVLTTACTHFLRIQAVDLWDNFTQEPYSNLGSHATEVALESFVLAQLSDGYKVRGRTGLWFQDGNEHGRCIYPWRRAIWAAKRPTLPSKAQVTQFLGCKALPTGPLWGCFQGRLWLSSTNLRGRDLKSYLTSLDSVKEIWSPTSLGWMPFLARLDVLGFWHWHVNSSMNFTRALISLKGHFRGPGPLSPVAGAWSCLASWPSVVTFTQVRYSFCSLKGRVLGTEVRSWVGQVTYSFMHSSIHVFIECLPCPRHILGPRDAAGSCREHRPSLPLGRIHLSGTWFVLLSCACTYLFVHAHTC